MRIPRTFVWVMTVLLASAFLLGSMGCTKYAKEKDLQALEQQKQATLSAEQELTQKQKERQDLENQLKQKQDDLAELQAEKDAVAKKVQ
jgi:septal ring factor EnvC (AmiA/AmiB activator)